MKELFSGGSLADDLIGWAKKIKALGNILHAFGTFSHEVPGLEEDLPECANELGQIIMDYADAIETVTNEAYAPLQDYFRDGWDSLDSVLQRYWNRLKEKDPHVCPYEIETLDQLLEEVNSFMVCSQTIDTWKKRLELARSEMTDKNGPNFMKEVTTRVKIQEALDESGSRVAVA